MFPCQSDIRRVLRVGCVVQAAAQTCPVAVHVVGFVRIVCDVGVVASGVGSLVSRPPVKTEALVDVEEVSDSGSVICRRFIVSGPFSIPPFQATVEVGVDADGVTGIYTEGKSGYGFHEHPVLSIMKNRSLPFAASISRNKLHMNLFFRMQHPPETIRIFDLVHLFLKQHVCQFVSL